LGWDSPEFAHLPLILKPNGKGKLSKRDGDKGGFPVFPIDWNNAITDEVFSGFRESGYFPEAFVNIMAFLGWNPGTEQEIFSMDELIKSFDLERVGKAGARFDPEKARWFNHQHLQIKSNEELAALFQELLGQKGIEVSKDFVVKVVALIKDRANFVNDFWEQASFFFEAPKEYDAKMVKKRWKENTPEILNKLVLSFNDIDAFESGNLETHIKSFLEKNELGMGQVMTALRLTLVGSGKGPGVFEIMELLGKEEVFRRVNKAIETIKK
jgi:glutamyl-tRNA synthetase